MEREFMGHYFGEFIRELRKDRKLTLREVEKKAKISNAYLSQVECGKRGTPTMKILVKLAEVYGVPVSALSNKVEAELAFEKEKAKKTKEKHEPEEKEDMPNLELDFLYRGYENLSEEKKRSLKDFFFYLQKGEKEYEER
jgi:transcriptional regulator with XRE-family HTH domain